MVGLGVGCGGGRNKLTVCRDRTTIFFILCSSISYSSPLITSNVIIMCQVEKRERKAEERGERRRDEKRGK